MKLQFKIWEKVLLGMILGIIFGSCFKKIKLLGLEFNPKDLEIIGTLFLNMMKMVVIPLIFLSILNGITNVNDTETFSRLSIKAFVMYMCTTMFAVAIGIFFAQIFSPGLNLNIELDSHNYNHFHHYKSLKELVINIIPSNPIKAMAEGNTLQVVVLSFFTGFGLILIGEKGKEVKIFVSSATHLVFAMINIVIKLTPYGVFAIMSYIISKYGFHIILHLGKFISVVLGALTIQYILFGLMILCIARLNPIPFLIKMVNSQSLALATSSSKATLATAIKDMTHIGVSKKSASFILPLGAAINMDATAMYLGISSIFFSQIFGIELTNNDYMIIIITSTIGSIGAAGFPGGSMVMMNVVLSSVGLPLEGMAIILGVDRILEMVRTMINITGDCTITLIIDKMEGNFNQHIYYKNNLKINNP